ncbi:molecular chaperone MKKS [Alosa pseudoharengus]|uniref:molecular chaperone MKKS n=1 Tax=Alosa pseudoharengus TaxID=34774 RepID=UPI003F88C5FB
MSRLCNKTQSVCTDDPLSDDEVGKKITLLRRIVTSCYGPYGRLKQVHNNVGGHVQTTSTSAVLFRTVQTSEPLLKLLIVSLQNHIQRFSDCGLFAAILCLELVENIKRLDIRTGVVISVIRHLQKLCNTYLMERDCNCKVKIDFNSCQELLALARSTIMSKPACGLNPTETHYISTLVIKAFLQTISTNCSDSVQLGKTVVVPLEGEAVEKSAVFPGILVDMPELFPSEAIERLESGPYRVAVFSASLSGDLSEIGEKTLEIHHGADPEADLLGTLLKLGEQVIRDGVTLFMCQRVIHPILQQYLEERGVIVVERLGIALLDPVITTTGAQAMATSRTPVPAETYGQVNALRIQCFGSRKMLHLIPSGDPVVCTMVLCHRNETMLDELKLACERAAHVLRLTLKDPYALLGGGCMETHLAAYIRHMSQENLLDVSTALDCSPSDLLQGADAFCQSLEAVAAALEHDGGDSLIDLTHAHRWTSTSYEGVHTNQARSCSCGLISNSSALQWTHLNTKYPDFCPVPPTSSASQVCVLDSFLAKLSALNVAVEMASFLLEVRYMLRDVN